MLILLILALVGSLLFCLAWYQSNWWGPRKKRRLLERGPLVKLIDWGFRPTENAYSGELFGKAAEVPIAFVGAVQGYATEISFGWTDRPHMLVRVFFEPGTRDYDTIMQGWPARIALVEKWPFRKDAFSQIAASCAPVYLDVIISYSLFPPKVPELLAWAEKLVDLLQNLHLNRMEYASGCELAASLLKYNRQRYTAFV